MFGLICVRDNECKKLRSWCLAARVNMWSSHSVLRLECFAYCDGDILEIVCLSVLSTIVRTRVVDDQGFEMVCPSVHHPIPDTQILCKSRVLMTL
jgi:hypothetical protein